MKSKEWVEVIRHTYPTGTRMEVDGMADPQAVPPGTRGTVVCVDDIGTIHVAWDNGSGLGLVPGEDHFHSIGSERRAMQ